MEQDRFKPIEQAAMTEEQRRVAQSLLKGPRHGPGPFHALLRSPELAERVRNLGDYIRFQNSLPAKVRELPEGSAAAEELAAKVRGQAS